MKPDIRREAIKKLYYNALDRLTPEEREREQKKSSAIPYHLSLYVMAGHFYDSGIKQGWLTEDGSPPSGNILAAVSGGGDSMALLWVLKTFLGNSVYAAHLNHCIRGAESDGDEEFVKKTALRWGLNFHSVRIDVPGSVFGGESLEAAARRIRYGFLENKARELEAWGIALGHNRDDVAETVLFNLLRGTGVRGSIGIPERRGLFFRPLLYMRGKYLRDMLKCRGLAWREDRTNSDNQYTRNFIRNVLFPLIEEKINKGAIEHLADFADDMLCYREEEEFKEGEILSAVNFSAVSIPAEIDRAGIDNLTTREIAFFIRAAGRKLGLAALSRDSIKNLSGMIKRQKNFEFPWGSGVSVRGTAKKISFF